MEKGRLEAFSDGVIAIIITIMVLELKVPHGAEWAVLMPLVPKFLCYVLSFLYVGIYWNNHHHLLKACRRVTSGIMWANLHLLFWLSLLPFVTGWMGENHWERQPTLLYGFVLFIAAISYFILQRIIVAGHGRDSHLASTIGADYKGWLSLFLYVIGISLTFWMPLLGSLIYALVAVMWLIPDRRVEKALQQGHHGAAKVE